MKRTVKININYANKNKLQTIDDIFTEAKSVINKYINLLWDTNNVNDKFVSQKVDTWLSARMQQALGKQALEIIKSQRKRLKKTKPIFNKEVINLDSRFIDIQFDNNSFDIWIKLTSIGNKINLKLPSKKHKLYHKYKHWDLLKSVRLVKQHNNYFIELFFDKKEPMKQQTNKKVAIDIGYKKLITSSNKNIYNGDLQQIYDKISRAKQGSKGFKRALKHRDNETNKLINEFIKNEEPSVLYVEDLKNVKHKSKLSKKVMNKVQRWIYSRVLSKLDYLSEQMGILLVKVSPEYTSQICNGCGVIDKRNRQGELYRCSTCGYENDADINAALNIFTRGVYSPSATVSI